MGERIQVALKTRRVCSCRSEYRRHLTIAARLRRGLGHDPGHRARREANGPHRGPYRSRPYRRVRCAALAPLAEVMIKAGGACLRPSHTTDFSIPKTSVIELASRGYPLAAHANHQHSHQHTCPVSVARLRSSLRPAADG